MKISSKVAIQELQLENSKLKLETLTKGIENTQLKSDLQALRERIKEIDPWVWDNSTREYYCVACSARQSPVKKSDDDIDFTHDDNCLFAELDLPKGAE